MDIYDKIFRNANIPNTYIYEDLSDRLDDDTKKHIDSITSYSLDLTNLYNSLLIDVINVCLNNGVVITSNIDKDIVISFIYMLIYHGTDVMSEVYINFEEDEECNIGIIDTMWLPIESCIIIEKMLVYNLYNGRYKNDITQLYSLYKGTPNKLVHISIPRDYLNINDKHIFLVWCLLGDKYDN